MYCYWITHFNHTECVWNPSVCDITHQYITLRVNRTVWTVSWTSTQPIPWDKQNRSRKQKIASCEWSFVIWLFGFQWETKKQMTFVLRLAHTELLTITLNTDSLPRYQCERKYCLRTIQLIYLEKIICVWSKKTTIKIEQWNSNYD